MADEADLEFHRGWVEQVFLSPSPRSNVQDHGKLTQSLSLADHVLRGSQSFAARSFRSRNGLAGLRVPSNHSNHENTSAGEPLTQIPPAPRAGLAEVSNSTNSTLPARAFPDRFRPSPTPSLKRKKAEAIVKAHGSPTHVRVTAGGRIVPSEQSPLCLPRYGYSAVKMNGGLIKFAPNHHGGKALQWAPTVQDGSQNGFVAQDVDGRLYQIVNGTILPLTEVDGGLRLYMPAPNLNITERGYTGGNVSSAPASEMPAHEPRALSQASVPAPQPSVAAQLNALELEYAKFDHELKDLNKSEVIHGKSMGRSARDALVAKRRELVITLDKIRKATKVLKQQPASLQNEDRPQTPKAGSSRPMSPDLTNKQPYLQHNKQEHVMQAEAMPHQQFFGQPPIVPTQPSFLGHNHIVSNDSSFMGPPYMMPPMGYYMNHAGLDGPAPPAGWGPPFLPYPGYYESNAHLIAMAIANNRPVDASVPQSDGAASAYEGRPQSPRQSHAVPLKDPETKQVLNVKSALNPMSPAYKPSVDGADRSARTSELVQTAIKERPPTPLSFTHLAMTNEHSQQSGQHATTTSSGSSIRTMNFFPHNTREHSMRKHEYPQSACSSEKENAGPHDSTRASSDDSSVPRDINGHDADWNPKIPARTFLVPSEHAEQHTSTPVAPPGTPVTASRHDDSFVHRHSHYPPVETTSTATQAHDSHDGASSSNQTESDTMLDFSGKTRAWIEGYQAGLFRRPVGAARTGDFLDGYCSGLLKSQPSTDAIARSASQPAEDVNIHERRRNAVPLELAKRSKDCLKEAIYSPSNEDAVLTPAVDGPSVEHTAFNLGAWQKQHDCLMSASGQGLAGFPFPQRSSSVAQVSHRGNTKDPSVAPRHLGTNIDKAYGDVQAQFSGFNLNDKLVFDPAVASKRIHSTTTVEIKDSNMLNQGKRIISPLEWRTRNSLAGVVNLGSNLFSQTQSDGQAADCEPMLTSAADISGSPFASATSSRFRETSLDGVSPTMSPEPISPPVSPRSSPIKLFRDKRAPAKESPVKQSPTKTKLEHIVSKVGIKVSPGKQVTSGEHTSPTGKRPWKDLWRGARTASGGKHEPL